MSLPAGLDWSRNPAQECLKCLTDYMYYSEHSPVREISPYKSTCIWIIYKIGWVWVYYMSRQSTLVSRRPNAHALLLFTGAKSWYFCGIASGVQDMFVTKRHLVHMKVYIAGIIWHTVENNCMFYLTLTKIQGYMYGKWFFFNTRWSSQKQIYINTVLSP